MFGDSAGWGSVRTIGLDGAIVAVLARHRARQNEWRLHIGQYWVDLDLVFACPDGSYLKPDTLSQQFNRLVKSAGLTRIRFHDLRHTHATLLIENGWDPKLVADRLGHSTVAFTLDNYVRVSTERQIAAADDFSRRLGLA